MVAAPGCACRVQRRSSANMLTAWSLVLLSCSCTHHMLTVGTGSSSNRAPHGFGGSASLHYPFRLQLAYTLYGFLFIGLDARPEAKSERAARADRVTSVGDLPTSSVSAVQLILDKLVLRRHPPGLIRAVRLYPQTPNKVANSESRPIKKAV
jgi:hypothetical protein